MLSILLTRSKRMSCPFYMGTDEELSYKKIKFLLKYARREIPVGSTEFKQWSWQSRGCN